MKKETAVKETVEFQGYTLWNADTNCKHKIVTLWSGYKCANCSGWFCL